MFINARKIKREFKILLEAKNVFNNVTSSNRGKTFNKLIKIRRMLQMLKLRKNSPNESRSVGIRKIRRAVKKKEI
jgi:hypothetical protein